MITPRHPRSGRVDRRVKPSGEPFVRLAALAPPRERFGAGPATYEERAGALINGTTLPEGLDRQSLDRLWLRLKQGRAKGPHGSRLTSRSIRRWVLTMTLLVASTGTLVATATTGWRWPKSLMRALAGPRSSPSTPPKIAAHPPIAGARPQGEPSAETESAPVVAPNAVEPAAPTQPGRPTTRAAAAPPPSLRTSVPRQPTEPTPMATDSGGARASSIAPTSPPMIPPGSPTSLAAESALLARAFAHLRQARDPVASLADLDQYATRFPAGVLAREADAARVDAFLLAGRHAEARSALSKLALGDGERDLELRLIRAELAAATSACAQAVSDYGVVLDKARASSLVERALWGRATCRLRLGDDGRARADLARYLDRFRDGPHASAARALVTE